MTKTTRYTTRATLPVFVAACGLLINPVFRPVGAQDSRSRILPRVDARPDGVMRDPQIIDLGTLSSAFGQALADPNRAVIGVTMSSGGRSDTLGVLVGEVSKGGPADKAGLKEGTRITAINGVNLRLSSSDADDEELTGIGMRRLQREMAKAKIGDEIELRVADGGASRALKVKTVAAGDLESNRPRAAILRDGPMTSTRSSDNHASLGVTIGSTGNVRDTLGLFISSVITKGPAESAGIVEGDRIAAINGVDVRVPREDAEDGGAMNARMNRFTRELGKAAPSDKIALKVYSAGRFRDVTVTAGKATEIMGGMLHMNGDMMQLNGMPLRTPDGRTLTLPRIMTFPPTNPRVVIRRNGSVL